ncbi:histidine kinase N-terminal 7TM domain-containing protein, partial [Chloroflexota bacterium]
MLAACLAVVGWRRRQSPGALFFTLLMMAVAWEYTTIVLEFASTTLDGKLFWIHMKYLESPFVGVLILFTALAYTKLGTLKRHYLALLLVIPVATVFVAWTDLSAQLLWRNPSRVGSLPIYEITFERGLWYWVHMGYFGLMVVLAVGLLIYRYLTTD